jgi:hypothetical protein
MSIAILVMFFLLVALIFRICNGKMNTTCMGYVFVNVLCIAAVYYWIYKEKENYVVRYNVKDISTFLL